MTCLCLCPDLVQCVLRAHSHPPLLQFLCHLFPVTFTSCLLGPPRHLLTDLQTAARDEPWVFGFGKVGQMSMLVKIKVNELF